MALYFIILTRLLIIINKYDSQFMKFITIFGSQPVKKRERKVETHQTMYSLSSGLSSLLLLLVLLVWLCWLEKHLPPC